MSESTKMMIKNDRLYDVLKYLAQIVLPALGTLYFALSEIWGLPFGTEIVGTIVSVDTFLGVVLGISSRNYYRSNERFDGTLDILEKPDGVRQFLLNLEGDPEYDLEGRDEIVFKVNKLSDR